MRLAPAEALAASGPELWDDGSSMGAINAQVQRALVGDVQATHGLLRHVAKDVRRTVKGILRGNHPELEDTIQEAFIAFIRALPSFRFESNISHYAVRIAFRVAIAAKRRARTWRERFRLTDQLEQQGDPVSQSPAEGAIAEQLRRGLDRALAKLPQAQSQVLVLWMVLEYSINEIASICDVSPNTVKSRLRLAREALRYYIERDKLLRFASGDLS